ncbi:hypothetical protein B0H10DRAFT_1951935 [Mycena sp. CBHHK59/15]|nr:hypothetical protein B0H10DRAFT_1951935 [Mycena sp. CBHHK59/15]
MPGSKFRTQKKTKKISVGRRAQFNSHVLKGTDKENIPPARSKNPSHPERLPERVRKVTEEAQACKGTSNEAPGKYSTAEIQGYGVETGYGCNCPAHLRIASGLQTTALGW